MDYILGIVVSLVVEVIKKKGGMNSLGTMVSLLVLSVGAATGYYFLVGSAYLATMTQILVVAASFHNLIIRQLQKND